MKSLPRLELYQRLPAVTIPEKASPGVVPIPILASPPPPVMLIVVIPLDEPKVIVETPAPLKSRKVAPYPMIDPSVLIPTPEIVF